MMIKNLIRTGVVLLILTTSFSSCHKDRDKEGSNGTQVSFTIDAKTATAPMHIALKNTTAGTTVVEWNFGNGKTSTAAEPEAIFNRPGTYTITLKVKKDNKEYTASKLLAVVEDPSLVAYYAFNNTVKDTSGRRPDAVLVNGAYANGRNTGDNALSFQGSSLAKFPQGLISGLPGGTPVSFSVWFKPIDKTIGIFGFQNTDGNDQTNRPSESLGIYLIRGTNSTTTLDMVVSGSGIGQSFQARTPDVAPLNQWTHLVWVNEGAASAVYINGVFNMNVPAINYSTLTYGFTGYCFNGGDFYFKGLIDEARIYKKALTPAEITALHKVQ